MSPRSPLLKRLTYPRLVAVDVLLSGMLVVFGRPTDAQLARSGLSLQLLYVLLTVFIAGLMVGRTPEYLGKKVEAREMKAVMAAFLLFPLIILAWTAVGPRVGFVIYAALGISHGHVAVLLEMPERAARG